MRGPFQPDGSPVVGQGQQSYFDTGLTRIAEETVDGPPAGHTLPGQLQRSQMVTDDGLHQIDSSPGKT
jgi:hypothetical protein